MKPKAVILAGGKGTRLGKLGQQVPKSLLLIADKPLISHHLALLKEFGIQEIVICVRHLSQQIQDFVGDGEQWGVRVRYAIESEPRGTAGAVRDAMEGEQADFFVLYGDVMMNFDLKRLQDHHEKTKALATLVLHPNDHPLDSDLVDVDREGKVISWYAKPHEKLPVTRNLVNAGAYIVSPRLFTNIPAVGEVDFGRQVFPTLVSDGSLSGYVTAEYLKDCGTPERLAQVDGDAREGRVQARRAGVARSAVFLDRDGVINEEVNNLTHESQLRLISGSAEAIARLNRAGVLVIVVTNQAVVAKGMASVSDVERTHRHLEMLLGEKGAYVDAIYWCPHHPERGFPGERAEYKISCECRKPGVGLIQRAQQDFTIDLHRSWIVGDSWRDIECGRAAGLTTIGVETGYGCRDGACTPAYQVQNLAEAAKQLMHELKLEAMISI